MKKLKDLPSFRDFAIMRQRINRIEDLARQCEQDKLTLASKLCALTADEATLAALDRQAKPKKQK